MHYVVVVTGTCWDENGVAHECDDTEYFASREEAESLMLREMIIFLDEHWEDIENRNDLVIGTPDEGENPLCSLWGECPEEKSQYVIKAHNSLNGFISRLKEERGTDEGDNLTYPLYYEISDRYSLLKINKNEFIELELIGFNIKPLAD